jgi:hypothetical protein
MGLESLTQTIMVQIITQKGEVSEEYGLWNDLKIRILEDFGFPYLYITCSLSVHECT